VFSAGKVQFRIYIQVSSMNRLIPEALLRQAKPHDFVVRLGKDGQEKLLRSTTLNVVAGLLSIIPVAWIGWEYRTEKKQAEERGETYRYLTPKKVMMHFAIGTIYMYI
jgi:hypothetical protein